MRSLHRALRSCGWTYGRETPRDEESGNEEVMTWRGTNHGGMEVRYDSADLNEVRRGFYKSSCGG